VSDYSPFSGKHRQEPLLPVLIETSWRAIGPSQRVIVCALYEGAAGRVEVRCHYSESVDHLFRSLLVANIEGAREVASLWKQAVIDKEFTELADGH